MSVRPDDSEVTASWGAPAARWSILVHGGAGEVAPESLSSHVAGCEHAAAAGALILARGGSALDAVQRAVELLESDPLFNAGTGSCLDEDGQLGLDASIMDGQGLRAGAVCAMPPFEHPVAIARRVMDASPHVLLAAEGAARFAVEQGFVPADAQAMVTERARARWKAARESAGSSRDTSGGTVGAVARDVHGHVAAATSTGGMVNKRAGRVGDSPIIGAGTYADDEAGACSTTGHGEGMIRVCLAKSAIDGVRGEMCGIRPEQASRDAIARMKARTGHTGGLIVVAADGALGLARTTRTMTWAAARDDADAASGS